MSSLYLDPEDLINLIAEEVEFRQEQIHFHITYYEGIAKIHKKNEAILALAACALLSRKQQISQQIIRNYSDSVNAYLNYLYYFLLGLISEKQENLQKAIEFYLLAGQIPQFTVKKPFLLKSHLLNCFIQTQSFSQAVEYFPINTIVPLDHQQVFYPQLAYCCEQLGETSKAIEYYQLIPNTETPENQAGLIWCSMLQGHENILEIEKKIEARPDNKYISCDWKYLLSLCFVNKGELGKALEILKEISEEVQKDLYFNALGVVYFRSKNLIQAFVSFLRAVKLNKAAPENWFNLALVYYTVNQTESQELMNKVKSYDKFERLNGELDESSSAIMLKFNCSLFGKPPATIKVINSKPRVVKKQEEKPQEVVIPTAVPHALPIQFPSLPMNAFFDNFLRFWNTSLQGRTFMGFPNGLGFYENRPVQVKQETEPELDLPRKRNYENRPAQAKQEAEADPDLSRKRNRGKKYGK